MVSAARSRISRTSEGPRSPSMIHNSCPANSRRMALHWSRGVASRPGRQESLSSFYYRKTGDVAQAQREGRFADAPGPRMITRFIRAYSANPARTPTSTPPGWLRGFNR